VFAIASDIPVMDFSQLSGCVQAFSQSRLYSLYWNIR